MFKLSPIPFDISGYVEQLHDPCAGALTSFAGWVRNHHDGKTVVALEYEAMAPLCEREAEKILREAKKTFRVREVICLHRVGRLNVGEMSVWVGVSAAHRDEAFKACRFVIDELKQRLPIWKKEFLEDGHSYWVNCQHENPLNLSESDYYSRQSILSEIGVSGQAKLKSSRILVVGAGGLGCAALTSLAQAGIGTIGIVEFDQLSISNLHRQMLYTAKDIGKNKIDLAASHLQKLNPFLKIEKFSSPLTAMNYQDIIKGFDILLDCTDNFHTKFLLNDIAVINKKILIQASVYQFEGQLRVYSPNDQTPCLRCLWPDIPPDHCVGHCAEVGVLGVVPSVIGHWQAWEAVKGVLDWPDRLRDEVLFFNFKNYESHKIKNLRVRTCPLCSVKPTIRHIIKENYMSSEHESDYALEMESLPPDEIKNYVFVDVREEEEIAANPVAGIQSVHLPFSRFGEWDFDFVKDKEYLIYCAHGMRSLSCVERLQDEGISNVWSINNGAEALQNYFESHGKAKP